MLKHTLKASSGNVAGVTSLVAILLSGCGGTPGSSPTLLGATTLVQEQDVLTRQNALAKISAGSTDTTLSTASTTKGRGGKTTTSPTPAPAPAPVTVGSTSLVSFKVESASLASQTNTPVTFGQVFRQGDVLATDGLAAQLPDGSVIPLQVDVKATHADASVRHAILSLVLPALAASEIKTLQIVKTSAPSAAGTASPTELTNAGFTASVELTIAGQIYTSAADALLKSGSTTTWLSGPVANEWMVSAPLVNAQGVPHPLLSARFAVRSYGASSKARVDVTIENTSSYVAAPQNVVYDAIVKVGGQSVYSKLALNHFHHARWRKTFWWGAAPLANVKHDAAYLIATKAVPNYDQSFAIAPAAISELKTSFSGTATEPMANGLAMRYMPSTGGRADIGLLPGWAATYLLSMNEEAKKATLGTADLAGSWSTHYRDKVTDRPISITNYPYMTLLGRSTDTLNPVTRQYEAFPVCGGDCSNPNTADTAHMPSLSYLPYLVTGDYYYLEEMQFYTMYSMFNENPYFRDFDKGLVKGTQVRGQAWTLRNLNEAAYITPDNDPLKAQFTSFLNHNLDWFNTTYATNASANALGALVNGYAMAYEAETAVAPWQDDFFTSAVGQAVEMGFSKAQPLLAWKAKFPVGRMTAAGYCWIDGSIYSLKLRDTNTSAFYTGFDQAYNASHTSVFNALTCAGAEMATSLGLSMNEMTGYSTTVTGFPSNMQPALAYSVNSGVANSAKAWQVFSARSAKPDYSTSPQFAIVPRI